MNTNAVPELRFLVTQRCNYKCVFCHGEGLQTPKFDMMTPDDICTMYVVGNKHFGITTATLTGGEPLVRSDATVIAQKLFDAGCKVTVTTNGSLLRNHPLLGKYIQCINLSLHTLSPTKYESIVQRKDACYNLMANFFEFRGLYPDIPICLNITVVDGLNSDDADLFALIEFATTIHASIKFIKLFPSYTSGFISLDRIRSFIEQNGFVKIDSYTRKERFVNGNIEIGLIKVFCAATCDSGNPVNYCRYHNDLFVSPDGKIKPCRHNISEVDLLDFVKAQDTVAIANGIAVAFNMLGKNCMYKRKD